MEIDGGSSMLRVEIEDPYSRVMKQKRKKVIFYSDNVFKVVEMN
jgi:hypothetical protein